MGTKEMCAYCFDSIISQFEKREVPTPSFTNDAFPLFVTWKIKGKNGSRLRGCIGTFSPEPLHSGLKEYARTSAFKDKRFDPLRADEISNLSCSISLLTNFEDGANVWDWELGKHGIIIEFNDPKGIKRRATYLPEVAPEQGWDKPETIDSLIAKAGWEGRITDSLRNSIQLQRYQSSKASLNYQDYIKQTIREEQA